MVISRSCRARFCLMRVFGDQTCTFWRIFAFRFSKVFFIFARYIWFSTVYFFGKISAQKYTVQMLIYLRKVISNRVRFGENFLRTMYFLAEYFAKKYTVPMLIYLRKVISNHVLFGENFLRTVYFLAEYFARK